MTRRGKDKITYTGLHITVQLANHFLLNSIQLSSTLSQISSCLNSGSVEVQANEICRQVLASSTKKAKLRFYLEFQIGFGQNDCFRHIPNGHIMEVNIVMG